MKNNKLNIIIALGLVLMAGLARIINHQMHLYNFELVGPVALFCGAVFTNKRIALLMPLLALLVGDLYIQIAYLLHATPMKGFYGIEQLFVYAGMIGVALLGTQMGQPKAVKVLGYAVAGSVVFFIISNFGVWAGGYYGYSIQSFINTYVLAIPFYKNTLIGHVAGAALLFGAYFLLQQALMSKTQKIKA
jgi:hypothetical protein